MGAPRRKSPRGKGAGEPVAEAETNGIEDDDFLTIAPATKKSDGRARATQSSNAKIEEEDEVKVAKVEAVPEGEEKTETEAAAPKEDEILATTAAKDDGDEDPDVKEEDRPYYSPGSHKKVTEQLTKAMTGFKGSAEERARIEAPGYISAIAVRIVVQLGKTFKPRGADQKGDKRGYMVKFRSLVYNLNHQNNENLAFDVLSGVVRPESLATMTPEEYAPKKLKEETSLLKAASMKKVVLDAETAAQFSTAAAAAVEGKPEVLGKSNVAKEEIADFGVEAAPSSGKEFDPSKPPKHLMPENTLNTLKTLAGKMYDTPQKSKTKQGGADSKRGKGSPLMEKNPFDEAPAEENRSSEPLFSMLDVPKSSPTKGGSPWDEKLPTNESELAKAERDKRRGSEETLTADQADDGEIEEIKNTTIMHEPPVGSPSKAKKPTITTTATVITNAKASPESPKSKWEMPSKHEAGRVVWKGLFRGFLTYGEGLECCCTAEYVCGDLDLKSNLQEIHQTDDGVHLAVKGTLSVEKVAKYLKQLMGLPHKKKNMCIGVLTAAESKDVSPMAALTAKHSQEQVCGVWNVRDPLNPVKNAKEIYFVPSSWLVSEILSCNNHSHKKETFLMVVIRHSETKPLSPTSSPLFSNNGIAGTTWNADAYAPPVEHSPTKEREERRPYEGKDAYGNDVGYPSQTRLHYSQKYAAAAGGHQTSQKASHGGGYASAYEARDGHQAKSASGRDYAYQSSGYPAPSSQAYGRSAYASQDYPRDAYASQGGGYASSQGGSYSAYYSDSYYSQERGSQDPYSGSGSGQTYGGSRAYGSGYGGDQYSRDAYAQQGAYGGASDPYAHYGTSRGGSTYSQAYDSGASQRGSYGGGSSRQQDYYGGSRGSGGGRYHESQDRGRSDHHYGGSHYGSGGGQGSQGGGYKRGRESGGYGAGRGYDRRSPPEKPKKSLRH